MALWVLELIKFISHQTCVLLVLNHVEIQPLRTLENSTLLPEGFWSRWIKKLQGKTQKRQQPHSWDSQVIPSKSSSKILWDGSDPQEWAGGTSLGQESSKNELLLCLPVSHWDLWAVVGSPGEGNVGIWGQIQTPLSCCPHPWASWRPVSTDSNDLRIHRIAKLWNILSWKEFNSWSCTTPRNVVILGPRFLWGCPRSS